MNFAFLALACFAKKTSQKRSCTHPRIPPSRTARESGAPFTWKSHTRDQNGKDRATRLPVPMFSRLSPCFQNGPPIPLTLCDIYRDKNMQESSMHSERRS